MLLGVILLGVINTFGTFPSVRLIDVVKIAQCLLTINIQRLLCTVIKLYVVKEAIQSSSSLPFITYFNLSVNAKTVTDFSMYFKDIIQYYYCQFSLRPLNRGARGIGVRYKGKYETFVSRPGLGGVYMRKPAPARVSYRDDFLISYRVYTMTGSFHVSLFEGTLHVDKIHV